MAPTESCDETLVLPEPFAELVPFVERWCNTTMSDQYAARLNSSIEEMQPFYDAVKERIGAIRAYLDGIDFEDYTEADATLGCLAISWVPVAEAIEVFKQPRVPDSKDYWELVEEPRSF